MFLIDSIIACFTLRWRPSPPQLRPLPAHITRTYVSTPNGDLELLICEPDSSSDKSSQPYGQRQPPIFFAHGGCGSAGVWLDWMTYLHNRGYSGTLYAYSLRNHGASYSVPYWRMVVHTSFEEIQSDMLACLEHVGQLETARTQTQGNVSSTIRAAAGIPAGSVSPYRAPIIVGHSSGGGLVQALLSGISCTKNDRLRTMASGICLVDAVPSYGSYDLYWNWFKQDPWFPLRIMLHLSHPNSPLSTDRLVHNAFFGRRFPISAVGGFRRWMPGYESTEWPKGMLGTNLWGWLKGGQNSWLDCRDIAVRLQGAERDDGTDRICIMVGKEDMIYRPWMWERQEAEYVRALSDLRKDCGPQKDTMQFVSGGKTSREQDKEIPEVEVKRNDGVRTVLVNEAGHHLQNEVDELKYAAAEALLRWANQV